MEAINYLRRYLAQAPELASFATQNGWPDNDTLEVKVLEESDGRIVVEVSFEEVIMEGAGCVAARQPCYGQLSLELDEQGGIRRATPL